MGYKLTDLIDIQLFQTLQERLNKVYSFPSSIIDNEGNILTATGWQDVCTKFHRTNKDCEKECIKSYQYFKDHIHEANPSISYKCPHGLIENATPIVIDGNHLGNFFTGQFFNTSPDMSFFEQQAKKYGFDESNYLEAVKKVPVWNKEQLSNYLYFINGLIEVIAGFALKNLKEIESNKKIKESEEKYRTIIKTTHDGFWIVSSEEQLLEVNDAYCRMSGYSKDELLQMKIHQLHTIDNQEKVILKIEKIRNEGGGIFESIHKRKDGSQFEVEITVNFLAEGDGKYYVFVRDISERKQSAYTLRENKETYRSLFEKGPIGIAYHRMIYDNNGRPADYYFLEANQSYMQLTGVNPLGKLATEAFPGIENDPFDWIGTYGQVAKTGEEKRFEQYFKLINRWYDIAVYQNKPDHFVVAFFEITKRKIAEIALTENQIQLKTQNEEFLAINEELLERNNDYAALNEEYLSINEELQKKNNGYASLNEEYKSQNEDLLKAKEKVEESEEKYKAAFMTSPDSVNINTIEGRYIDINIGFTKLTGYSHIDVIGKLSSEIDIWAIPKDRIRLIEGLKKNGVVENLESVFRKKDGGLTTALMSAKFIKLNGENHILSTTRDISERKKMEVAIRKFNKAIESSKTSIIITDYDGNIEYGNPYFSVLTGYSPSEYLGQKPNILKSEFHDEAHYQDLWNTIKSGMTWEGEFYNIKKNGEYYWENAVISPVKNEKDVITNFVAIKTDITDNKRIFTELLNAKEKAEESDRLKTAFLNNMSHEVRTPLNAITGFSKLITRSNLSPEKNKEYSTIISASSVKLIEIITDIIEISQIHAHIVKANISEIDLISFIQTLARNYSEKAMAKNIEFITNLNIPYSEYIILTDVEKLIRLFTHLLDNAIKFTPNGSVEFNCELKDGNFHFTIEDTGIGISPEMQEVIFEPFRQVEVGMTRTFGGNGLGLAIAKTYTEMLKGSISLKSDINKGTKISVKLPAEKKNSSTIPHHDNNLKYSIKTILIAEDEYSNYEYLRELLDEKDLIIIHATDGQQTIDLCRKNKSVDLILMDIKMPVIDGYKAAKIIKEFRPSLPIIAQTAFALQVEKEKYVGVFDDYITKPIDEFQLRKKLNKYIEY